MKAQAANPMAVKMYGTPHPTESATAAMATKSNSSNTDFMAGVPLAPAVNVKGKG